ncbi:hypothetical protein PUN28_004234 [Cardiocondyla obscurior]|uniref:Uncharacterized protein n=1 Tax=Cardiocondyla obscurior TaxID=286306 RepID=A0AAW2GQ64_9HYME
MQYHRCARKKAIAAQLKKNMCKSDIKKLCRADIKFFINSGNQSASLLVVEKIIYFLFMNLDK